MFIIKQGIISFVAEEAAMAQTFIIMHQVMSIVKILLLPIGICTYANIYIKKLHDQFDLYIKQPQ
jgi:hypothetical protein